MKFIKLLLLSFYLAFPFPFGPPPALAAQARGATVEEIHRGQSLGRVVVAPDGSYFLYEWNRPYNWVPSGKGLTKAVASRQQTKMYRVPTPAEWGFADVPDSKDFIQPAPGATYYLGSLSPDAKWVSIYELDRDDNTAKAGIVAINDEVPSAIVWFDIAPDLARLELTPAWAADGKSLTYPIKGGLARADAATGKALKCSHCAPPPIAQQAAISPELEAKVDRTDIRKEARLIAAAPDGSLGVFLVDTKDELSLYLRKSRASDAGGIGERSDGQTVILFENPRNERAQNQK